MQRYTHIINSLVTNLKNARNRIFNAILLFKINVILYIKYYIFLN